MSKYTRHQSIISRNTDEHISEDHWLKQFEKNLQKGAVQPKSKDSIYDQINSIMNGSGSKFNSVQEIVNDMMGRSGLSTYLKVSEKEDGKTKIASEDYFQRGLNAGKEDLENHGFGSDIVASILAERSLLPQEREAWIKYFKGYMEGSEMKESSRPWEINRLNGYFSKHFPKQAQDQNSDFDKAIPVEPKQEDTPVPDVIKQNPAILQTLENYIRSTRGNLPIPAILDKIRSIHQRDIAEDKLWEDDKLIRLISKLNLQAKKDNPASYENYSNLAAGDRDTADSDVDPSNTDAFNALMPAKL